jgi:hypothetical protein
MSPFDCQKEKLRNKIYSFDGIVQLSEILSWQSIYIHLDRSNNTKHIVNYTRSTFNKSILGTRLWTLRCMKEVNGVIHSSNSSKSGSDIDEADDIEVQESPCTNRDL